MKKKLVTLMLATCMVMGCLVGCGNTEQTNESTSKVESKEDAGKQESSAEVSSEAEEVIENFNKEGYPIVNEEITLKILYGAREAENVPDPDELEIDAYLEELTGIKTEWELVWKNDWETKVNLMFASGEYPDLIIGPQTPVDYEEYGVTQQILIPLDDLIEKYMPNYTSRAAAQAFDPTLALIASDGQKYALGNRNGGGNTSDSGCFVINREWLDALGLETPSTIEELTDVLRAFKTQDPNGNGEADEIPLMTTTEAGFNQTYGLWTYMQLFGLPVNGKDWLRITDDEQIEFIPTTDEYREGLEWFHTLYEENLLDPEMFSMDVNTIKAKLNTGTAGFSAAYRIETMGLGDVWTNQSELWVPDSEKIKIRRAVDLASPSVYVTKSNEHVEATMRFLDAMLDTEIMWTFFYGPKDAEVKGWHYEDGKVKNHNNDPKSIVVLPCLDVNAFIFAPSVYYNENVVQPAYNIEKFEINAIYEEAGLLDENAYNLLNLVVLSSDQNQEITLLKSEMDSTVLEYTAKFIKEGVTDDSWNAYVAIFKDMGAEKYVQMYQEGYDNLSLE